MDDMRMKFYKPVVVGTPSIRPNILPQGNNEKESTSFQDILNNQLSQSNGVTFSKHAVKRVEDHNIDISNDHLARLNEGVRIANEKNLEDALILIDQTAFIVNARNNTVITTKAMNEIKGNVFTNINGTVII